MGLKLTNEAPVSIKAGLRASYQWLTQVEPQTLNSKPYTLHMGLKLTNEAPVGIKAGLRASYQ